MGYGFVMPQVDETLFKFRKSKGVIVRYDAKQLKGLLNALDDECKMFQLLALNCGFYQIDLCNLRHDQIVTVEKELFIVRARDKSSHQKRFRQSVVALPRNSNAVEAADGKAK